MQENSITLDVASKQSTLVQEKSQAATTPKNQLQNNITPTVSLQESQPFGSGPTERKPLRFYQKNRHSSGAVQTVSPTVVSDGTTSESTLEARTQATNVSQVRASTPSFQNKVTGPAGQNVTHTPIRQVRGPHTPQTRTAVPSSLAKNPLRSLQPEMDHLTERVKQEKLKQMQNQRQFQGEQRTQNNLQRQQVMQSQQAALSGSMQRSQMAAGTTQQTDVQKKQQLSQIQQLQKQMQANTDKKVQIVTPLSPPSSAGHSAMDVDPPDVPQEKGQLNQQYMQESQSESESASESIAYLQKVIDNPANTIVQHQIQSNTAKMLVMLLNGEQRLITFDIPNEDCTVQDLLEQANISFCGETTVSLVSDRTLGINYIVEAGPGTLIIANDSSCDQNDGNSSQDMNSSFENSVHTASSPDENSNPSAHLNEEALYIQGKLALCPHCGISSFDFTRCLRCKTRLPDDVKTIPLTMGMNEKKGSTQSADMLYKKNNERNSSAKLERLERDGSVCRRGRGRGRGVAVRRPIHKEPECLTISSDEEEEGKVKKTDGLNSSITSSNSSTAFTEEMETLLDMEPVITNNSVSSTISDYSTNSDGVKGGGKERDSQNFSENSIQAPHTALECRTVRIGSYKYVPRERVVISQSGVRFGVPLLEDDKNFVTLDVKFHEIVRVLIHFGKQMPVLFFYTSTHTGAMIRELLGMQDPKGPYYDPASKDHTHKRITLLPEKVSEESKLILRALFTAKDLLMELNPKQANDILVRASPKDSTQTQSLGRRQSQAQVASNASMNGGIQTITVYPPPPAKGGIAINTEDYMCLGEDQFLNDVIIDFYLKYLTLEVLSETDQQRTHVFSSYFYKRLTSPHAQASEASTVPLSPAAKRHARVQKWTKNVNIFEKDFVIIPINEHAHWFLAIICFPGLVGKVFNNTPAPKEDDVHKIVQKSKKLKEVKVQAVTIGSTTITPVTTTITIDQVDDGSERDEAEGDDEEMEMESDEDEEAEAQAESKNQQNKLDQSASQQKNTTKVPCILIFDSLAGASRSRVVATLRDYLSCEHVAKMGVEKTFSKDTIKGACPKVPQQSNFTDCGLYVLQYVESFFKSPIEDYTLPIKTLKNWFEEIVVTRKREELSKLLIKLVNSTKGDRTIALPAVNFPTQEGKLKPKPENHVEAKPTKPDMESKKKPTTDAETRTSNSVPSSTNNSEATSELITRTTYQIIPISSSVSANSTDSSSSEMLTDPKTPHTRSSSETMSYLKSKRIPRLMSRTENQDDPQAAKKHKGESFDSCK